MSDADIGVAATESLSASQPKRWWQRKFWVPVGAGVAFGFSLLSIYFSCDAKTTATRAMINRR